MAVLKKTLLAALALAYTTSAIPLAIEKRDAQVTETVWVTVDTTTTVWINGVKPTPDAQPVPAAATTTPVVQPVAPAASPATASPAVNAPAAFAAQAQPAAPAASSAPPAAAPVAATPASSPSVEAKTAGASSGGPCEGSGNVCSGDVTYYEGGLGACGWNVNTGSDMSIALPHGLMGTQSNGNPYCGRKLSIKAADGSIVSATVGDKCMGCEGQSIDLTDALFKKVVPNGDGRVKDVQWWFD